MELVNHKNERKSFQRFIDNNIKAKSNNDSLYDNTLNRKKIYIFDVMFFFKKNMSGFYSLKMLERVNKYNLSFIFRIKINFTRCFFFEKKNIN